VEKVLPEALEALPVSSVAAVLRLKVPLRPVWLLLRAWVLPRVCPQPTRTAPST
jgi:hypothetical protein